MKYLFNVYNIVSVIFKIFNNQHGIVTGQGDEERLAGRELKKVEFELRPKD